MITDNNLSCITTHTFNNDKIVESNTTNVSVNQHSHFKPRISIVSLIYKSGVYADFVHDSLYKYTPELHTGEAEFYFIANDASIEVINHLTDKGYKYYINTNVVFSNEELFKQGYGKPEYINRVYKGWNEAIRKAQGEIVVLVNSDMSFSDNWLINLISKVDKNTIVSSKLIERGHEKIGHFSDLLNGTGSYVYHCGKTPRDFDNDKFISFANSFRTDKITKGGVFMPCAFLKENAFKVGLYPEGNIAGRSFDHVVECGDHKFFRLLNDINVKHITTWDSIVYHFQQGEMEFAE